MAAKHSHGEREINKFFITLDAAAPLCDYLFELVEPGERPFSLPLALVTKQWAASLTVTLDADLAARRNQFDAALCQLLIERTTVVGAILHRKPVAIPS
jgi:hypothetical protein